MFYIQLKKNLIKKLANSSFSLISSFLVSDVSNVSDSLTISHFLWEMWANRSGCSPKMSDVSGSLRSLTKNEQPLAIRSHRSEEMSNREQIPQVANQKWANEWVAHFFEQIAHLLIFGQKTSDSLWKPMSEFPALVYTFLYIGWHATFIGVNLYHYGLWDALDYVFYLESIESKEVCRNSTNLLYRGIHIYTSTYIYTF